MHDWSENWPYFNDVSDAADYIGDFLRKWGRVEVRQTKEKYGTARVYLSFGWHQLHSITHPGYCFSRYPNWLWKLDCQYLSRIVQLLNVIIVPYHIWLFKKAYTNAIKKWPHVREEILTCADFLELLDNCDDIKLQWHPPAFSEKDKKRLGAKFIECLQKDQKLLRKLNGYKCLVQDLRDEGRLKPEELEYLVECVEKE